MIVSRKTALLVLTLSIALSIFIVRRSWTIILPNHSDGYYTLPKVQTHEVKTKSGLELFTPDKGDQCWDDHLTCVPYPNLNLRLRVQGNIGAGFTLSQ